MEQQEDNKINKVDHDINDLQKLIEIIDPNNEIFIETNMLIEEITENQEQEQQYVKTKNSIKE